ncbi:MAG: hypothetical protein ACP5NX_04505 [Candidatus Bilamarchaeaceae archaeon]
MALKEKPQSPEQKFLAEHREADGWNIIKGADRMLAFRLGTKEYRNSQGQAQKAENYVEIHRMRKENGVWKGMETVTGDLTGYQGFRSADGFIHFLGELKKAGIEVKDAVGKDNTLKRLVDNPLAINLDTRMLVAIVMEEILHAKPKKGKEVDTDKVIDLVYVLFTSDMAKRNGHDSSVGVFQVVGATHEGLRASYPKVVGYAFGESDTYLEQGKAALMLAYENLNRFYRMFFMKSGKLRAAWEKADPAQREKFVAFITAGMHNMGYSRFFKLMGQVIGEPPKYRTRRKELLVPAGATLEQMMTNGAKLLNGNSASDVGTGNYSKRIFRYYAALKERGFAGVKLAAGMNVKDAVPVRMPVKTQVVDIAAERRKREMAD